MEKKFVDNDVFTFRVFLNGDLDNIRIPVYTPPFPQVDNAEKLYEQEDIVREAYFTPERINELKQMFIRRITENENPFRIECIDRDGGYNVTEDMLFTINKKSPSV